MEAISQFVPYDNRALVDDRLGRRHEQLGVSNRFVKKTQGLVWFEKTPNLTVWKKMIFFVSIHKLSVLNFFVFGNNLCLIKHGSLENFV